jgi:nitroreductase
LPEAPIGKSWRFTVIEGSKRDEMVRVMRAGLDARKASGEETGSARWTANCMAEAPVTVFVHNPEGIHPWLPREPNPSWMELADVQPIGAAIENMLLAAQALGIGSLWIADVWYAYRELNAWLGTEDQMVAAVSFGYPDENPAPRPRKPLSEIVRYL